MKLERVNLVILTFSVSLNLWGIQSLAIGPQSITLDLKLEVNNKIITQPIVVVPLGKKSSSEKVMTDNSTFVIEVTPKQDIDNQVYLDFTLKKIVKGKSLIISHPRIITLNNQEAILDEGDSATSGDKNVVLSVTPHLRLN